MFNILLLYFNIKSGQPSNFAVILWSKVPKVILSLPDRSSTARSQSVKLPLPLEPDLLLGLFSTMCFNFIWTLSFTSLCISLINIFIRICRKFSISYQFFHLYIFYCYIFKMYLQRSNINLSKWNKNPFLDRKKTINQILQNTIYKVEALLVVMKYFWKVKEVNGWDSTKL